MLRHLRVLAIATATCAMIVSQSGLALASSGNREIDSDSAPVIFDALVMRPLGFAVMCGGFVLWLAHAPIMAITRPKDMWKPFVSLVILPSRFTFVDPLGKHPDRAPAEFDGRIE